MKIDRRECDLFRQTAQSAACPISHRVSPWTCQHRTAESPFRLAWSSLLPPVPLSPPINSLSHPLPPLRCLAFIVRLCVGKRPPSFLSVGSFRLFSGRIFTKIPVHSLPPTRYAPFFSCASVPHAPFTTLRSPPPSLSKSAMAAANGTEVTSYIITVSLSVSICSVTAMGLSLNLRNLPVLSRSLLAKLHIPSFTLDFFHYPFPALISLRRTPNGRISGRFASQYPSHGFDIEMMKARSLLRSISGHPSPPSHAPSFFRFQRPM